MYDVSIQLAVLSLPILLGAIPPSFSPVALPAAIPAPAAACCNQLQYRRPQRAGRCNLIAALKGPALCFPIGSWIGLAATFELSCSYNPVASRSAHCTREYPMCSATSVLYMQFSIHPWHASGGIEAHLHHFQSTHPPPFSTPPGPNVAHLHHFQAIHIPSTPPGSLAAHLQSASKA